MSWIATGTELYEIFKQAIPDGFSPRYSVDRSTANVAGTVKITPNIIMIKFLAAESPEKYPNGEIKARYRRIIFAVYTDRGSKDKIRAGEKACVHIMQYLNDFYNKTIEVKDDTGEVQRLRVIRCDLTIEPNDRGMTAQGVHLISMEYKLTYKELS